MLQKRDDYPVHNTQNNHPPKMDVFPTNFLLIILAANWLVCYSSLSSKQQRGPLPSLLCHQHVLYTAHQEGIRPCCGTSSKCTIPDESSKFRIHRAVNSNSKINFKNRQKKVLNPSTLFCSIRQSENRLNIFPQPSAQGIV